jgi:hypothetical protein
VIQGSADQPGERVDLPGTDGVQLLELVDLMAEPERAPLHTYPLKGGGKPTAVTMPPDARAPAVMLTAESSGAGKHQRDLGVVLFAPGKPRLVLEFPLASSGGPQGNFSTILGPDLRKSSGPMLEVVMKQTALPKVATGLPGPPTAFVCRWQDTKYQCGR